uniref:U47-Liphistoxin-Lth1b_1 n=1 Tax=Liphistius thaleban TaxID=1905330 RepID=A0A4Q8K6Y4_9ARAC
MMNFFHLWLFIFNEWWMILELQSKFVLASLGNEIPCSNPLGLMSGMIRDWQMSASSNRSPTTDPNCQVKYGRLMEASGKAWCAGRAVPYEWLQIDLGVAAKITALMTQGRCDGHQWVTSYHVSYSMDAFHWKYCSDAYNKRKLFNGNNDSHSMKISYLDEAIVARFIRFHVMEWRVHPSMRVEIVGCQECNELISLPPRAKLTASSWRPWKKQNTCSPQDGSFYSHGAWCAKSTNANQWLQVDLGPPTLVTGMVTKGRGDGRHRHWVTSYTVTYSNDSLVWYYYRDGNQRELKEFGGNMDQNTDRRHYLNQPFVARYIRFQPIKWKKRVSMRIGVIGCPHTGNEDSQSVALWVRRD